MTANHKARLAPISRVKAIFIAIGAWTFYTFGSVILTLGLLALVGAFGVSVSTSSAAGASHQGFFLSYLDLYYLVILIASCLMMLFVALWYWKSYMVFSSRKERKANITYWLRPKNLLTILLLTCAVMTLSTIVEDISAILMPEQLEYFVEVMEENDQSPLWYLIPYTCLIGPIAEELTYRGIAQHALQRSTLPVAVVIVIQAALFGLMHMMPFQIVYTFGVGLILGWICYKTHSLIPTIIVHILNNVVSMLFGYVSNEVYVACVFVFALLGVAGVLLIFFGKLRLQPAPGIAKEALQLEVPEGAPADGAAWSEVPDDAAQPGVLGALESPDGTPADDAAQSEMPDNAAQPEAPGALESPDGATEMLQLDTESAEQPETLEIE